MYTQCVYIENMRLRSLRACCVFCGLPRRLDLKSITGPALLSIPAVYVMLCCVPHATWNAKVDALVATPMLGYAILCY